MQEAVPVGTGAMSAILGLDADKVAQACEEAAHGEGEQPVAVTAPPVRIHEEAVIRDRRTDRDVLRHVVEGLAARACRRLRPFGLAAGTITVELRRGDLAVRREENVEPGVADEETARAVVSVLVEPILEPASTVRAAEVRSRIVARNSPTTALSSGVMS